MTHAVMAINNQPCVIGGLDEWWVIAMLRSASRQPLNEHTPTKKPA